MASRTHLGRRTPAHSLLSSIRARQRPLEATALRLRRSPRPVQRICRVIGCHQYLNALITARATRQWSSLIAPAAFVELPFNNADPSQRLRGRLRPSDRLASTRKTGRTAVHRFCMRMPARRPSRARSEVSLCQVPVTTSAERTSIRQSTPDIL
jgi:hypothetical protein